MQPACDHAPGVGLHGEHGPEAVAEGLAHQVGAAAGLELDDVPAGQAVLLLQLPGPVQGLQPQEAQPHLRGHRPAQPAPPRQAGPEHGWAQLGAPLSLASPKTRLHLLSD